MLDQPERADDGEAEQIGADGGHGIRHGPGDLGLGQAVRDGDVEREQCHRDGEHGVTEGEEAFGTHGHVTAAQAGGAVRHIGATRRIVDGLVRRRGREGKKYHVPRRDSGRRLGPFRAGPQLIVANAYFTS